MGARINWKRTRKFHVTESKYEAGMELKNGVVIHKPLDNLATRARKAERLWLQQNRMNTIYDRPPKKGRKKQKRPSKTVYRPAPFEDVVMDVLNRKGRS